MKIFFTALFCVLSIANFAQSAPSSTKTSPTKQDTLDMEQFNKEPEALLDQYATDAKSVLTKQVKETMDAADKKFCR